MGGCETRPTHSPTSFGVSRLGEYNHVLRRNGPGLITIKFFTRPDIKNEPGNHRRQYKLDDFHDRKLFAIRRIEQFTGAIGYPPNRILATACNQEPAPTSVKGRLVRRHLELGVAD